MNHKTVNLIGNITNENNHILLNMWNVSISAGKRPLTKHQHLNFEIMMVESGSGIYTTDSMSYSITKGDIFSFAKRCGCPTGIAHTDLFAFIQNQSEDPYRYFKKMAEQGIFWELNVNFDSSHEFKTHAYVTEFFKNKKQQEIVKKSGVKLSVGFYNHNIHEYKASRVQTACKLIKDMGIRLVFENI